MTVLFYLFFFLFLFILFYIFVHFSNNDYFNENKKKKMYIEEAYSCSYSFDTCHWPCPFQLDLLYLYVYTRVLYTLTHLFCVLPNDSRVHTCDIQS